MGAKVVTITSGKGGVGKTTTTANIGVALARLGKKTVVIDADIGLRNLDVVMGLENRIVYDLVDVVEGRCRLRQAMIKHKQFPDLYLIPAAQTRDKTAISPADMIHITDKLRNDFDFIIIDCPPSLNMLTVNALVAADGVVIPMQCEYYALEGLSALMDTITAIRDRLNPGLHIEGILRTMYDPRNKLTTEVNGQLFNYFGDAVYRTVVPRNVRLAEAPSYGKPVISYDRQSRGAIAYLALAGEMLRRSDEAARVSG